MRQHKCILWVAFLGLIAGLATQTSSATAWSQQPAAGADINQQLLEAVQKGDKGAVESLLAQGADRNAQDDGKSVLISAAAKGYNDIVQTLLRAGADINSKDRGGHTALIAAAGEGHVVVVATLLAAKADMQAVESTRGDSALIVAAFNGRDLVVRTLVQAGADVGAQNRFGMTALIAAAEKRHWEYGNLVSPRTPVTDSARTEAVRALLAAHADANAKDNDGVTSLMFAADGGLRDVVGVLLAAGADPSAKTGTFETLKCRISSGNLVCPAVKVKGWTPLKAAKDGGYRDIVEMLKKAGAKD